MVYPRSLLKIISSTTIVLFLNLLSIGYFFNTVWAQPSINDPNLKAEVIVEGLSSPTSMAFMDNNNILILEKEGQVRLVSNGMLQEQPVLQVLVDSKNERGLLGIAVLKNNNNNSTGLPSSSSGGSDTSATVFLYFTEQGEDELRNRVYKYSWNGGSLVGPSLILDLPAGPGTNHQGGKLKIGPDKSLYAVIGDLNSIVGVL